MYDNINKFEYYANDATDVTYPAPTNPNQFFIADNTDRYIFGIRSTDGNIVKFKRWLLY